MAALMKYEVARRALAEAHKIDEVKDMHDKAKAMEEYALRAKDTQLLEMATDIKMHAERRAGEMLRDMDKNKGSQGQLKGRNSSGGRNKRPPEDVKLKLSDIGITKDQSSKWQKYAAIPEDKFEEKITKVKAAMKDKVNGVKRKRDPKETAPASHYKESDIEELFFDKAMTNKQIAALTGIGFRQVRHVTDKLRTERAAVAKAQPEINAAELSMTAQQKLDLAIKQHQKQLDAKFKLKVDEEVRKRIDEIVLPSWKQQIAAAKKIANQRKGILKSKEEYNTIRRCLHPDSRKSVSDAVLGKAFDMFTGLEKFLLNEEQSPTTFADIPGDLAEWDKMRAQKPAKPNGPTTMKPRNF